MAQLATPRFDVSPPPHAHGRGNAPRFQLISKIAHALPGRGLQRAARRRGVLGAAALALGAFGLTALALSSLAGLIVGLWPLLLQPTLWESIGRWLAQLADVCLAVGGAVALLLNSLFDAMGGPIVLVYMLGVLLLSILWSRLVLRRVRAYRPVRH